MAEPVATSVPIVYPLRALERLDRRAVNRALGGGSAAPEGNVA
jgi:hypothetical protein